jgi:L-fuconolactonase
LGRLRGRSRQPGWQTEGCRLCPETAQNCGATVLIIDAHQHFWTLASGHCTWLRPQNAVLYRDYMPDQLEPMVRAANVGGTILVQAAPSDAETEMLLGVAQETDWVLGVVGWADVVSPSAPARIRALAGRAKLRGLRPTLPDPDDDAWHVRAAPALAQMSELALSFDALARPHHLGALDRTAREHPELAIVIDHAANPPLSGDRSVWTGRMRELAARSNVVCKVSGLLTQARSDDEHRAIPDVTARLVDMFGPKRLLWGSDWPVLNQASDFAAWLTLAQDLLRPLGAEACAQVFGGAARRVYRL